MRKGRLVGCKVTLRKTNLFDFIDTLSLSLSRREKQYPFSISKKANNSFPTVSFRFGELVLFYPIEAGIGLHSDLEYLQRSCSFSSFPREERYLHFQAFHFPVKSYIFLSIRLSACSSIG